MKTNIIPRSEYPYSDTKNYLSEDAVYSLQDIFRALVNSSKVFDISNLEETLEEIKKASNDFLGSDERQNEDKINDLESEIDDLVEAKNSLEEENKELLQSLSYYHEKEINTDKQMDVLQDIIESLEKKLKNFESQPIA